MSKKPEYTMSSSLSYGSCIKQHMQSMNLYLSYGLYSISCAFLVETLTEDWVVKLRYIPKSIIAYW